MTLIEVLVAAAIGTVLVGGLMATFLTVLRLGTLGGADTEATGFAQQALERFRNHVACDDWFAGAGCTFSPPLPLPPLTFPPNPLYGTGTGTYTVTAADCDGVGGPGDCLKVVTTINWTPPS